MFDTWFYDAVLYWVKSGIFLSLLIWFLINVTEAYPVSLQNQ